MLHLATVDPKTLEVLRQIFSLPELEDFALAGGTALALRYGHRKSIDLDLFGPSLNYDLVSNALIREFGEDIIFDEVPGNWAIFSFIQNIKVDIIPHEATILASPKKEEGLLLYSDEDIIAMKVHAIFGRGVKKDFWDIHELLHYYPVETFIDCYQKKYPKQRLMISVPQALTYFADAEESEQPVSLKNQNWESVKSYIRNKVSEFLR
ncbi:MAG: nucleotidyl transferase AbiEii/AbiGii toxin family protein [Cyclobacteriaceae bacterium]